MSDQQRLHWRIDASADAIRSSVFLVGAFVTTGWRSWALTILAVLTFAAAWVGDKKAADAT